MTNRFLTSRWNVKRARRTAFTLLELMLALALTAVLLVLMNMAIDLHLRSLDARRTQLEESQLARSVLRIIADDVRGVVQSHQQDVSSVEAMIQQATTSATAQVASSLQSATSSDQSSTSSSNSQTSTSSSGSSGSGSSGASSQQTSGGGSTSSRSSGATTTNSSSATSSSNSSSSGGSSTTMGTTKSSGSSSSTESQATADLSTVTVPELPGVYGNQYQLQIDISRLPRVEQYQTNLSDNPLTEVIDIPSDVKTVTYYVQTPPAAALSGQTAKSTSLATLTDPNANLSGLVRRELDRAVTSSAMNTGNITGLENSGEILAPEVTGIEFRYFDGSEWRMEWDTSTEEKLPLAIQILMSVATHNTPAQAAAATAAGTVPNVRIYSMVVNLPTGGQSAASESSTSTSDSGTSNSGASSTTNSSSTGATQ